MIAVKASLDDDVRRFSLRSDTYAGILERVAQHFQLGSQQIELKYVDEEGDAVTFSSDSELQEAVRIATSCSPPVLRVHISMAAGAPTRTKAVAPEPGQSSATTSEVQRSQQRKLVERDPLLDGLPELPNGPYMVYEDEIPALDARAAARAQMRREPKSCLKPKLKNLQEMVQSILSENSGQWLEATTSVRKLFSSVRKLPPIDAVIQTGVVPTLSRFLECHEMPKLQFEAAWALTNIASGTAEHTKVVIEHGAIPAFVKLLLSQHNDVREQAVWALGNIAGDSPKCRDMVLQSHAMMPLLHNLRESPNLSMLRKATWTLSKLCRGKPQPDFELVRPALATLAKLIYCQDKEVLSDACWALSYLSDGTNDKIQAVIEAGVCRHLVDLLMHESPSVQTPALRAVGNIVTGDDLQTQIVIHFSVLPALLSLLNSHKKGIRKEACWAISNITAGNKDQIQSVIEANIVPPIIALLSNAESDIKKEAAWAISNVTSGGTPQQIKYLVQQGCIKPLCDLLTFNEARIVTVALEGLENILKVGENEERGSNLYANYIEAADGLSKIEALQHHETQKIYETAVKILENYFADEEEPEDQLKSIAEEAHLETQLADEAASHAAQEALIAADMAAAARAVADKAAAEAEAKRGAADRMAEEAAAKKAAAIIAEKAAVARAAEKAAAEQAAALAVAEPMSESLMLDISSVGRLEKAQLDELGFAASEAMEWLLVGEPAEGKLVMLSSMGFMDEAANRAALDKAEGSVSQALDLLC